MDSKIRSVLIDGVIDIGNQINQWRNNEQVKKIRNPKDFKTEADFKADLLLRELILKYDKKGCIISEEDDDFSIDRPEFYWLIDPIDGTASWYDGFKGFVTQIAYIQYGIPVFGIIYAPALKNIWWGSAGVGAFKNGKQIEKPKNEDIANVKLIDNYPEPRGIAKKIFEGLDKHVQYIESGSLGLKSVLVADGSADLFVKDVIFRDWDVAPAYVLLKELGCFITDKDGNELSFSGQHEKLNGLLVSSSSKLSNYVTAFIKTMERN